MGRWGKDVARELLLRVSNLLSSPASGEVPQRRGRATTPSVSNLLSSPASGEYINEVMKMRGEGSFQFIEFPSEWGAVTFSASRSSLKSFPIY